MIIVPFQKFKLDMKRGIQKADKIRMDVLSIFDHGTEETSHVGAGNLVSSTTQVV
jgi:hypothetical protein